MDLRLPCIRLMKRAVRLAKNWHAVVPAATESERSHLMNLIKEEFSKHAQDMSVVDNAYIKSLSS